jgi:uncharacterized membrane protein YjjP (DUF1212 family)
MNLLILNALLLTGASYEIYKGHSNTGLSHAAY